MTTKNNQATNNEKMGVLYRIWMGDSNDRQECGKLLVNREKVNLNFFRVLKDVGFLNSDCPPPDEEDGDEEIIYLLWYTPCQDNTCEFYGDEEQCEMCDYAMSNEYVELERVGSFHMDDEECNFNTIFGTNELYKWGFENYGVKDGKRKMIGDYILEHMGVQQAFENYQYHKNEHLPLP